MFAIRSHERHSKSSQTKFIDRKLWHLLKNIFIIFFIYTLASQQRRECFIQASSTLQSSLNLTLTAVFTPSSEETYWPCKEFLTVEESKVARCGVGRVGRMRKHADIEFSQNFLRQSCSGRCTLSLSAEYNQPSVCLGASNFFFTLWLSTRREWVQRLRKIVHN